MLVQGKNDEYTVGDVVAANSRYRVRRCLGHSERELLLQVAIDPSYTEITRNAWALARLKEEADEVERQYAEAGHKGPLNYDLGFPELCDCFSLATQGDRPANVLGFRSVELVSSVVPLVKIWKGSLRVDLRTSAWIMGKLLKVISFAHDNGLEVGKLVGGNILIEPDKHFVLVFDWSRVVVHVEGVPASVRRQEVRAAAAVVIKALGDDLDRARVNEADLPYTNYLQLLATDGVSDAGEAHQTFYGLIDLLCEDPDSVWEKEFYKFTTFRRM